MPKTHLGKVQPLSILARKPQFLWPVEEGPVYGPTLPQEAENPNVVMGGIYPNPRIYVFATTNLSSPI